MDDREIYVKVKKDGPYLVYGKPPIDCKTIETDENGVCINYGEGQKFEVKSNPIALCRCGKTKNAPFCDGSHNNCLDERDECADFKPIEEEAIVYKGKNLTLKDNEKYCALARFCDANGSIWNLIYKGDEYSDNEVKRQTFLCPSGRLMLYDNKGNRLEPEFEKSISALEDTGLKISGPLWLKGGIRVESSDGKSYEIRNRQTLCRCGQSKNKPFCDCTHKHINFKAQSQE
ncbi:MAG: CDGSH iron-sulfur domain-containing protein [Candidatus Gastranaerophilaceae bacterium]